MNHKKTILIAGGDLRYGYTARMLADYYQTYAIGFTSQVIPSGAVTLVESVTDGLPLCDVLVLPMPVSDDGVLVNAPFSRRNISIKGLIPLLKPDAVVLGGKFGKAQSVFTEAGLQTVDYLEREELSTSNAVPTAEGAIQIMLEEMPVTIYQSRVLIAGFGRIGKRLAATLHAMGAEVTIAARSVVQRTEAELYHCNSMTFSELEQHAGDFDVICNTVPAQVITEPVLARMQEDALLLDLASKPGGIDWDAAQALGRRVVWALSLPGKTAPVTAGEIIARTILHILEEREMPDA